MGKMSGRNALNVALDELLDADNKILCLGEDIGAAGGCWGYFSGLQDKYGKDRIIQTPISEMGYAGVANGLAYGGYRPIVEFMFADFATLAADPIINMAAKARYNSNGKISLPITFILPEGGGGQSGCQHSQSVEAWFANIPGLKLVAPTTPEDLRYFLKAAVMDDDPVCFFFSRTCAMRMTGEVNQDAQDVPSLKNAAKIVRKGTDLTVVAWHRPVYAAIEAAEEIEKETGKSIEIIDPRVLCPFDADKVYESVRKTGKALVCNEAPERGSFAQLISAWIGENCFDDLKAPVSRVGGYNTCIPFGAVEEYALPQKEDIKIAMMKLLSK